MSTRFLPRFSDARQAGAFMLAVLCLSVLAGWLLRSTAMVEVLPNQDPMPISAALALLLIAVRHMLPRQRTVVRVSRVLSWAIFAVGAIGVLQFALNRNLGLDLPDLHRWINDPGAEPGRMPLMVALCLVPAGLAGALDRPRPRHWRGQLLVSLDALLMLCACMALIFNWVDLRRIFGLSGLVNAGLPGACALLMAGLLSAMQRHEHDEHRRMGVKDSERRMLLVGGLVAGAAAVTAGLVGVASQQRTLENMIERGLASSLNSRIVLFASALDVASQQGQHLAKTRTMALLVHSLLTDDPAANGATNVRVVLPEGALGPREAVAAVLGRMVQAGDRSAALVDLDGQVRLLAGQRMSEPELRAPLATTVPSELLWNADSGLVLRSRMPLEDGARSLGSIEIERSVDTLAAEFFSVKGFGKTGKLGLCMLEGDTRVCFPDAAHPKAERYTPAGIPGGPGPMLRSIAGEQGVASFVNPAGVDIVAAYGPLAPGLGAALAQDTYELFAPLRRSLSLAIPLIMLLVLSGVLTMRMQLAPLVASLARALRIAGEQESRIRSLSERVAENARDIERADAQLHYHATHDALTGLANRATLEKRVDHVLARKHDAEAPGHALILVDLDQFKIVNDTCGHPVGDELLRQLVAILRPAVRTGDVLARMDGDEFALLLESCAFQPAVRVAESLRQSIAAFQFDWEEHAFRLTASVGVVCFESGRASRVELMRAVDSACLLAKERGRNRVETHALDSEELRRRAGETHWFSRLQKALERDEFVLYRQRVAPGVPSPASVQRYEVLLRLRVEDGQMVAPGLFIPAAERYGLMPSIDRAVVMKALAAMAAGAAAGDVTLYSINLSGGSINDASMTSFLIDEVRLSGVDPKRVCFEITETEAIANLDSAARMMHALRKLGCRIALDDFGAGMSSFAYLRQLPVDTLKIDGRFVKGMLSDSVDLAMVEAMHGIAERLGLKTVAEFVENDLILARLRELGVHYMQGYAIAMPEPMPLYGTDGTAEPSAEVRGSSVAALSGDEDGGREGTQRVRHAKRKAQVAA